MIKTIKNSLWQSMKDSKLLIACNTVGFHINKLWFATKKFFKLLQCWDYSDFFKANLEKWMFWRTGITSYIKSSFKFYVKNIKFRWTSFAFLFQWDVLYTRLYQPHFLIWVWRCTQFIYVHFRFADDSARRIPIRKDSPRYLKQFNMFCNIFNSPLPRYTEL